MRDDRSVSIYLEPGLLQSAQVGAHNFIGLMQAVLEQAGLAVHFLPEAARPARSDGLSLVHMTPPIGQAGLTFRRVYHYPFWQIDQTDQRWAWDTARAAFDPAQVDADAARKFQRFWRKRMFGEIATDMAEDGYIYVPLQGRLTEHRSFQSMSPLEMIETTLDMDMTRRVVATLHPKESYSKQERAALDRLAQRHHRLEIADGPPAHHLPRCAYVVTQNSAAAFEGYFLNRPAILFSQVDFHHVAQSLHRTSAHEAFEQAQTTAQDYARYLYWFWQIRSINAGRDTAPDQIAARFRRFGWPV